VGTSNLVKPALKPATPGSKATAASKATTAKSSENNKPAASTAGGSKGITGVIADAVPSSITTVLRQAAEQTAQKAKDVKKKVVQTLDGTAETPVATKTEKAPSFDYATATRPMVDSSASLQSASGAWNRVIGKPLTITIDNSISTRPSMQSPTSTAWKTVPEQNYQAFEPQVTKHRGSSVSMASAEEIKQIEEEETIKEEDEEAIRES
jgi:hypothetical protein